MRSVVEVKEQLCYDHSQPMRGNGTRITQLLEQPFKTRITAIYQQSRHTSSVLFDELAILDTGERKEIRKTGHRYNTQE